MIGTVNLNPCLDRTVEADMLISGALNRVRRLRVDVSGKGVNAALAAVRLGGEALCAGLDFSQSGGAVGGALTAGGVRHALWTVQGYLRENVKLSGPQGAYTEINESGCPVGEADVEAFRGLFAHHAASCAVWALCGSLPPGIPEELYGSLAQTARGAGASVVLDASGVPLALGLKARPALCKPNREELGALFAHNYNALDAVIDDAAALVRDGVGLALVSLGGDGALLAGRDGVWYAPGLDVPVRGLQGAGDTMTASACLSLEAGIAEPELLRRAVAASAASVMRAGTELCAREDYEALLPRVRVQRLH